MGEPIRILHVLGNTNLGGAESRIMDLYRCIDRSRVQFDFLVHAQKGHFDKEIEELGGHIYRVPRFRMYNYFCYRKELKKFFEENHEFTTVQGHMTSTASVYLPIAKRNGISVTVAHARSAGVDKGIKGTLTKFLRRNLSEKTDYMFTCSKIAGISVFGKRAVDDNKVIFVPNAIDCAKFAYDAETRHKLRAEMGIEEDYVIGHVGRFHYAKNHEYLLAIFAELQKKGRKNYKLLLLGEGNTMQSIKNLTKEMKIEDKVIFAGNKTNIYDYYQVMDYFVYPSRYEGLPGTVVEAQAAGLKCLMSDAICDEVSVTPLVQSMSIQQSAESWAEYIINTEDYERVDHVDEMRQAGFDVKMQAEKMMCFYETGRWI